MALKMTMTNDPKSFISNNDLLDLQKTPHLWNLNNLAIDAEKLSLFGWCLPMNGILGDTDLIVNGQRHPLQVSAPSTVYSELYPWYPNAAFAGFQLEIPHKLQDFRSAREITVQPASRRTDLMSAYALDVLLEDLHFEMPPADAAARIGVSARTHYTILGRSIYRSFERALKKNFKSTFADYQTIVDWGCGSGRVGRHVVADLKPGQKLLGFDIDRQAIGWANDRFGKHFHACSIAPPLEVKEGSVDLLYAYSVLTHLKEADMKAWVAEMSRVVIKGGVFLFTVMSDAAMVSLFPATDRDLLIAWNKRGIFDSLGNQQLDTIDVGENYYRNVWMKQKYIIDLLGSKFEVMDFIQGFHFYQSLVVARRL